MLALFFKIDFLIIGVIVKTFFQVLCVQDLKDPLN